MTPTIAGPDGTDDSDEPGGRMCFGCREDFDPDQHAYREVFGKVVEVTDHGLVFGVTGGVVVRHWCRECWNRKRGREKAAHYNLIDRTNWIVSVISIGGLSHQHLSSSLAVTYQLLLPCGECWPGSKRFCNAGK